MKTYDREQWLVKPRRYRIDNRGGKWLLIDGLHVIDEFDNRTAARVARRKAECRGSMPLISICSVLLPNPEPWAWQNGQLDESILSLMDVHRHYFYADLDAR